MAIQNRIVMPAMHLSYAENGFMNERLIEFYKERAVNQAGLIIIGGCYVDPLGKGVDSMIAIDDDKYIEGLARFATEIHGASSTKIAVQLYHSGRYSFEQIIHEKPVSSSVKYSSFSKSTPRALGTEEIPRVVEKFAAAAARAKKAGFDAVEIVGSAGYLIDQFLSPLINDRTDRYGGSFENRLRFPMETISACKAAIGENMPYLPEASYWSPWNGHWMLLPTTFPLSKEAPRCAHLFVTQCKSPSSSRQKASCSPNRLTPIILPSFTSLDSRTPYHRFAAIAIPLDLS